MSYDADAAFFSWAFLMSFLFILTCRQRQAKLPYIAGCYKLCNHSRNQSISGVQT